MVLLQSSISVDLLTSYLSNWIKDDYQGTVLVSPTTFLRSRSLLVTFYEFFWHREIGSNKQHHFHNVMLMTWFLTTFFPVRKNLYSYFDERKQMHKNHLHKNNPQLFLVLECLQWNLLSYSEKLQFMTENLFNCYGGIAFWLTSEDVV